MGTPSLHRQLLLWLLLPQLVLWLAAAAVTYHLAERYARGGIDASLLQATRALARQVKPIGSGLLVDFPRAAQAIIEADPEDRVYYMVSAPPGKFLLGNRALPAPPPRGGRDADMTHFYDAALDGSGMRVAALYVPIGMPDSGELMLVQVARSQTSRNELARHILNDTVLPLSALIVLMTMIVWAGIRVGLAPLSRLRDQVENRAPDDLTPLALDAAPREVRSLAAAVNQLLEAVRENVSAQRRFISNAAHQLRTPLAGLKSQAELALDLNTDPAVAERLRRVRESAVRAAHLINQLLTLARAEPESAEALPRNRVDLRQLVADVAAEQVPRAMLAGIDLGVADMDDAWPQVTVWCSEVLLREAVLNLVDNAIRYAGRGAEVTLSVHTAAGMAVLEVADNGPGLAADQHDAVFGRFYRATHEGAGCGLGLAIVREIALRHGGRAHARPLQPHGLSIRLELPLMTSLVRS